MASDSPPHAAPDEAVPVTVPAEVDALLRGSDYGCDAHAIERLARYLGLLVARNAQMNLTRVDPEDMWQRHILDSLSLLAHMPERGRYADLGSGGGLPGIPLSIARPGLETTLVESVGKKASFLRECGEALGLTHLDVRAERLEDLGRGPMRERFHVVSARALARLPVLLELAVPLLAVGGQLLAIKGEQADVELAEAKAALGILKTRLRAQRRTETGTILVFEKLAATPGRYPRRPGEPKRKPLC